MTSSNSPFRAILNTNTQTRRLGYLIYISNDVKDHYRVERELISRLEKWGEESEVDLKNYISNKGIVRKSKSSSGARRYIDLAQNIEIITKKRRKYRPSKIGSVITSLDEPTYKNPFHIKQAKVILLYKLLLADADYMVPLLSCTQNHNKQLNIRKNFYKYIINHFRKLRDINEGGRKRRIDERISKMKKWEKPEKYLEHIVMPRLHWGLDLKLLDWNAYADGKRFILSRVGKGLLDTVLQYEQTPQIDVEWCQNELFKVWAQYSLEEHRNWSEVAQDERMNLIVERVKEASGIFQTMAYPRLPALQIVLFSIATLLHRDHIAAGFDDIKQSLRLEAEKKGGRWDFRWFQSDNDGFIRIRN